MPLRRRASPHGPQRPSLRRPRTWWESLGANLPWVYLSLLIAMTAGVMLAWPIVRSDTDTWFHLENGRYLFTHGAIPHQTHFSFLEPPRESVNYSWLFQALVYWLSVHWGYYGLIVLRAAVFLATAVLIARLLGSGPQGRSWWSALPAVLCTLLLFSRDINLRPHIFTYLFIVLTVFIIERRPRWTWLLPGVVIVWNNVHGIMYPVVLLIGLAYGIEYAVNRLRGRPYRPQDARQALIPLVVMMCAIFVRPRALDFFQLPFPNLEGYLHQRISEFSRLAWRDLLTIHINALIPQGLTVVNLYGLLVVMAVVRGVASRTMRLSHLLLCLGGVAMASRGVRFVHEFALLSLPLLAANPRAAPCVAEASQRPLRSSQSEGGRDAGVGRLPRPAAWLIAGLLMLIPIRWITARVPFRPAYPFSRQALPVGVATFLNQAGSGGALMNAPNSGGYLRWMLSPRYRIFMDMEQIFTDEDFYQATQAFVQAPMLRRIVSRYDPSFITAPMENQQFAGVIKEFPEYVPVFFDDAEILYASRLREPDLTARYALQEIDLLELAKHARTILGDESLSPSVLQALERLIAIDPGCGLTRYLLGLAAIQSSAYDQALSHAGVIVEQYPEWAQGHALRGRALRGLGRLDEASRAYRRALRLAPGRSVLYKELGLVFRAQHQPARAYRMLKRGVDLFGSDTSLEDLYLLGSVAREAGKLADARAVFQFMLAERVSPGETTWIDTLATELSQ